MKMCNLYYVSIPISPAGINADGYHHFLYTIIHLFRFTVLDLSDICLISNA